jgi:hypothetical protein
MKMGIDAGTPIKCNRWPIVPPAAAPINNEGEKIPNENPKQVEAAVRIIFDNKRTISVVRPNSKFNISRRTVEPRPKASGTNNPIKAQIATAIRPSCQSARPDLPAFCDNPI